MAGGVEEEDLGERKEVEEAAQGDDVDADGSGREKRRAFRCFAPRVGRRSGLLDLSPGVPRLARHQEVAVREEVLGGDVDDRAWQWARVVDEMTEELAQRAPRRGERAGRGAFTEAGAQEAR